MSSLFDTRVSQRRNQTPWAKVDVHTFMRDMAVNGQALARLECMYRPDVASRMWYSITWTDEHGQEHRAEAQDLDLCLWRAAEIECKVREKGRGKIKATE